MTGTEIMRAILDRESLSPTKVSVEMKHGRAYLNTLFAEKRDCKLETLVDFCEATGYEIVVRSQSDSYEFEVSK